MADRWKMVEAWRPPMYPGEYPEGKTYLLQTESLPHLYVAEFFSAKDATLASAAPELLEALENLINNCECRETGTVIADFSRKTPVDAARAAIAKAKGKQS